MDYLEISVNSQIDKGEAWLEERMKIQRGSRGIALLFLNHSVRWGGWSIPAFTNKNALHVTLVYKGQSNSWIDKKVCKRWFLHTLFSLDGRIFLQDWQAWRHKIQLLLDSCNTYCHDFELQSGNISVLYLPSNVMSLIQPIDQGVIQNMKCYYQWDFLCKMVNHKCTIRLSTHLYNQWCSIQCCLCMEFTEGKNVHQTCRKLWQVMIAEGALDKDDFTLC